MLGQKKLCLTTNHERNITRLSRAELSEVSLLAAGRGWQQTCSVRNMIQKIHLHCTGCMKPGVGQI